MVTGQDGANRKRKGYHDRHSLTIRLSFSLPVTFNVTTIETVLQVASFHMPKDRCGRWQRGTFRRNGCRLAA